MINRTRTLTILALTSMIVCASPQGFNVDFDGNGLPSSCFGAAANQSGFWNYAGFDRPLQGLDGNRSGVRMRLDGNSGGGGSNYLPINTGDFARLLNDGVQVGPINDGGRLHITLEGLASGVYRVFAYAVSPSETASYAPVYVPQATDDPIQVVTGPMPGNSFEYLVTHSIHEGVVAQGGVLEIILERAPFSPSIRVNGFQVVPYGESYGNLSSRQLSLRELLAR